MSSQEKFLLFALIYNMGLFTQTEHDLVKIVTIALAVIFGMLFWGTGREREQPYDRLDDETVLIDGKYYRLASDAEAADFIWGAA